MLQVLFGGRADGAVLTLPETETLHYLSRDPRCPAFLHFPVYQPVLHTSITRYGRDRARYSALYSQVGV